MKKKWMNKLIELLNEYEEQKEKETWLRAYEWESCCDWYLIQATNIVTKGKKTPLALIESRSLLKSKDYWFIKRLVDNDKIDLEELQKKETELDICITFHDEYDWFISDYYRQLLMLLSIQENPIQFLISILK